MRLRPRQPRLGFAEQLELEEAFIDAFAPLAAAGTAVSAARVRARVHWRIEPERDGLGWLAVAGRLAETSLAVAFTAFLFIGSFGTPKSVEPAPETPVAEARADAIAPRDQTAYLRALGIPRSARASDDVSAVIAAAGGGPDETAGGPAGTLAR